jgi:hypothetical protein
MTNVLTLRTLGLATVLGIVPGLVAAQEAASFQDLPRAIAPNQRVVITDVGGGKTRGNVIEVTPSTITLSAGDPFDSKRTLTFDRATVATIRRSDRLWNGLLIGVAAGFAATEVWSYSLCGTRSSNFECAAIATGVGWFTMVPGGAVAGALIDKAIGNNLIYISRPTRAELHVSPSITPRGAGLTLALTF